MPKHSFDPLSLIFALLFGGVAVMAFVGPTERLVDPRWIGPALLVLLGLMLLVPSQRARKRNRPPEPADSPTESSDRPNGVSTD